MVIAALIVFAILLIAWVVAPSGPATAEERGAAFEGELAHAA
jgi:hypothetical protein